MKADSSVLPAAVALAALLFGTPMAYLYLGGGPPRADRSQGGGGGPRVVLAGLIEDGSTISLSSLKFLVDVTCLSPPSGGGIGGGGGGGGGRRGGGGGGGGGSDAHVIARLNADELTRMHREMRDELHPPSSGGCGGTLSVRPEPESTRREYENRVDRLAALRDLLRRTVRDALLEEGSSEEAGRGRRGRGPGPGAAAAAPALPPPDLSDAVVIVADLDVAFLPPYAGSVLPGAASMLDRGRRVRTRIDVLCSAGADAAGGYYDSFATILLPDTFVYPLDARMDPIVRSEEDGGLILGNGGFSPVDLMRWFDEVGGGDGDGDGIAEPVPVRSCFGGLALYRAERWLDSGCGYSSSSSSSSSVEMDNSRYANRYDRRPCEHVVLHNCLRYRDPLTTIAVQPDMRPLWHAGDGDAISARNHLDELRRGVGGVSDGGGGVGWADVERGLEESFRIETRRLLSAAAAGRYDGTICPGGRNATTANATDGCCWDNTTEILLSERSLSDSAASDGAGATSPVRSYALCPNLTYPIGEYDPTSRMYVGGMAAIELFRPNVTVRCGLAGNGTNATDGGDDGDDGDGDDGGGGGNCTLTGGTFHFWIRNDAAVPLGHGVTVRGITSVNASGINVIGDAECDDEGACGSAVKFRGCTFANNDNDGVVQLVDSSPSRNPTIRGTALEFDRCSFVNNSVVSSSNRGDGDDDVALAANFPNTALSFANCSFHDNRAVGGGGAGGGGGVGLSALVLSQGILDVRSTCFVGNTVGLSLAVADGMFSYSGNGYADNVYSDPGACVDGIDNGGVCYSDDDDEDANGACRAAARGGPAVPCGPSTCEGDRPYCCNRSCGICAPIGGFCTQQTCEEEEEDEEEVEELSGTPCGPAMCGGDEPYCCNESCGICTEFGGFCIAQWCGEVDEIGANEEDAASGGEG